MDDSRLEWMREVIYSFLAISHNDAAFNELLRDEFCTRIFHSLFSGSEEAHRCIFFYFTIEEEEVEREDTMGQVTEDKKQDQSESSGSDKLESDNISDLDAENKDNIEESTEILDDSIPLKEPSGEFDELENENEEAKEDFKKSTTILRQIIKKTVIHLCLNITQHVPCRRYVYFILSKLAPIPEVTSLNEAFEIMPQFFETGSIMQHPLISLKEIISRLYYPLFAQENMISCISPTGCKIDEKEVAEIFSYCQPEMKEFIACTKEIIAQIEKPFMFQIPAIPSHLTLAELGEETDFVAEVEELASEWSKVISNLIIEISLQKPEEIDLLSEIQFWKKQKFILSTCCDHLNHNSIQQSIKVLELAKCNLKEFHENVKEIEIHLNTATDNVNYLLLLEPNAKKLLPMKSTQEAEMALDDIFMLLKMIWIQSAYYKQIPNMSRLIKGIGILLQEKVKQNAHVKTLFMKSLLKVTEIVSDSSQLLHYWKQLYLQECEDVKKYGSSFWWGFDIRTFFDETDYIAAVCEDLEKISKILAELRNIFNANLKHFVQDIKGLNVLEGKVLGLTTRIQWVGFDIYDPGCNSEWKKLMNSFYRDEKNLEDEIKRYLSKMFHSSLSWENAYILTKSFQKLSIPPTIKDFINKSRDDMVKQFLREISETENEFLSINDEPPHFQDIPAIASSILWIQNMLIKLSEPAYQICDHIILSRKELEVQARYQKTERLLKEFKIEKYEKWKITANEDLNKFLHASLLRKSEKANLSQAVLYTINFTIHLEEVSIEAKLLEYFGYEIPAFVKNIILQERSYYEYRSKMKLILKNLKNSVHDLKDNEISVLAIPIQKLCSVVDLGVTSIQWESSEVPDFIKKMKKAVDVFRGIVAQVKNVTLEINKNIMQLSYCDLFFFPAYDSSIPTCESFFGAAETEMDVKVAKMISIHKSLELLLIHLEKITCGTTIGTAEHMRLYYFTCEENILNSLIKMMMSNLEYFKEEILSNFIFPYIQAAYNSNDELVKSSITRSKLIFVTFIRNAVESTRKIIRWQNGTCKESLPFYLPETKQVEFSFYLDLTMHSQIKKMVLGLISKFFYYMKKL